MADFSTLRRHRRPNDYLVLPEGLRSPASPDRLSPLFQVSRDGLGLLVKRVALAEPRTVLLENDKDGCRFEFRQRSRLFRFPDYITVECHHAPDDRSTLAIWSRSRYGISDRGVNGKRVERWIGAIEARLAVQGV